MPGPPALYGLTILINLSNLLRWRVFWWEKFNMVARLISPQDFRFLGPQRSEDRKNLKILIRTRLEERFLVGKKGGDKSMPITINSRILLSVASLAAAAALVIGATFAFFSDVETSNDNVFSAGTLDLELCDGNEPCADGGEGPEDSVTASFGAAGMAPDDCTGEQTLTLKNIGSIDGNHVDMTATNTDSGMAAFLRLGNLTYDGVSQLLLTETNGNGFSDLDDLANQPDNDLVNLLPGITAGAQKDLIMDVCLDDSAGDDLQEASNTLDLSVTMRQQTHASEGP